MLSFPEFFFSLIVSAEKLLLCAFAERLKIDKKKSANVNFSAILSIGLISVTWLSNKYKNNIHRLCFLVPDLKLIKVLIVIVYATGLSAIFHHFVIRLSLLISINDFTHYCRLLSKFESSIFTDLRFYFNNE